MNKPSPGKELIDRIKKEDSLKKEAEEAKKEEPYVTFVADGVEVIDAKAIPKKPEMILNKFGIPEPKERRSWDKL